MSGIIAAVKRIRKLECPTGDLKHRISEILQEYDVAPQEEIMIYREKELDRQGAEAYNVTVISNMQQSIVVLAEAGQDDYVAKVVDAYIE